MAVAVRAMTVIMITVIMSMTMVTAIMSMIVGGMMFVVLRVRHDLIIP